MDHGVDAFAARGNARAPMRLGQRYDAERFLPDPGNTVVCHLDRDADGGRAVLAARAQMQALPGAERFLFTPEDSLHMTVFEGVLDNRRQVDAWPEWMDRRAPVERVTQELCKRLQGFEGPGAFNVRVAQVRPGGLVLEGATEDDEARMRDWREALAEAFGYRQRVHDAYGFHMTFAYPVAWLSDAEVAAWETGLARIAGALDGMILPLKRPAFCRFADMTWFEELVELG